MTINHIVSFEAMAESSKVRANIFFPRAESLDFAFYRQVVCTSVFFSPRTIRKGYHHLILQKKTYLSKSYAISVSLLLYFLE